MTGSRRCAVLACGLLLGPLGCSRRTIETPQPPPSRIEAGAPEGAEVGTASTLASAVPPNAGTSGDKPSVLATAPGPSATTAAPAEVRREPDGNDDGQETTSARLPASGRFERIGKPPAGLRQICDLTTLGDSLYAAHALVPLGADGATITQYRPAEGRASPFSIAFDWNRPGQPTKGGGAGQGFLRVRSIGGRLYVPDADPPYAGLGLVDWGTEGYVFVSSPDGRFAQAVRPKFRPPAAPDASSRPGASVLPRAYHVIDVIRFRNRLIASTGSVPPKERAWTGPSPGALHVANDDLSRFLYEVGYPFPYDRRVWRLTYMVRFRDRLYIGLQDYDAESPNDFLVLDPPGDATTFTNEHLHPVRVTESGGGQTLRWFTDRGRLYWIVWESSGVQLRVSDDGTEFRVIPLPAEAGRPSDILRYGDDLVILTEEGLYRLDEAEHVTMVAPAPLERRSPFELRDLMCGAPLAIFRGALYAGGQRDAALYRLTETPPSPAAP